MIKLIDLLSETIKKVDDKWVVYPKKGGKRLGTHDTKEKALKQLAAIEINKENVNEVGEGNVEAYDWEHTIESKEKGLGSRGLHTRRTRVWDDEYRFKTDSGLNYIVRMSRELSLGNKGTIADMSFEAFEDNKYNDANFSDTFTRGEMYRVMATIMEIANDYIENNPNLQTLVMAPAKAHETDNRRKKLYLTYIKKNMPKNASVEEVGDDIEIHFNK